MIGTKVLDHGYIKFIESWGHGESGNTAYITDYEVGVIEAARQSTQGNFHGWEKDEKLLKYLYTHKHNTPFEFSGMIIEVQAPIFVFREWQRHRTQSYNEMSARYAPLPDLNYIPSVKRLFLTQEKNIQAQAVAGAMQLNDENANYWIDRLNLFYERAELLYQAGLSLGIPKELARIVLPVGRYSRMRASTNLRNWLAFLTLRMDPNAQWEIRQYANEISAIIKYKFPKTWELFMNEFQENL